MSVGASLGRANNDYLAIFMIIFVQRVVAFNRGYSSILLTRSRRLRTCNIAGLGMRARIKSSSI